MRIGIDVRMIFDFPTGIGNYRRSLITALFDLDKENKYILIGNDNQRGNFKNLLQNKNVSYKIIKSKANHPSQHLTLQEELLELNLDIFYTTPWGATYGIPCKYVLEVPDLIYRHYPEFGSWKSKLYELLLEKSIAKSANHIVTISDFVKSDICKYLDIDLKGITNLKGDVSADYSVIKDESYILEVLREYDLLIENDGDIKIKNYFVYLGNQRPHKNLVGLLKAFEMLMNKLDRDDVYLVIIGGVDAKGRDADSLRIQKQLDIMSRKENVLMLGKIFENKEVSAIFNRAIAMVHPSLHEGFGMTPLEAMRSGCPVIASDTTAMPEVIGDAGIKVDPNNIEEIAEGMEKVFLNKKLNNELREKSLAQSRMFSWKKTAKILLNVFLNLK